MLILEPGSENFRVFFIQMTLSMLWSCESNCRVYEKSTKGGIEYIILM